MAKGNPITQGWAARPIEMLESPAYRALSLSAHRALSRIEIELAHHGGKDNGKLPVTFDKNILKIPDETVARALAIANKAI
jgi:hypothetical protein